ncbi:gghB, partial [Symbiodinium sp. KB8]
MRLALAVLACCAAALAHGAGTEQRAGRRAGLGAAARSKRAHTLAPSGAMGGDDVRFSGVLSSSTHGLADASALSNPVAFNAHQATAQEEAERLHADLGRRHGQDESSLYASAEGPLSTGQAEGENLLAAAERAGMGPEPSTADLLEESSRLSAKARQQTEEQRASEPGNGGTDAAGATPLLPTGGEGNVTASPVESSDPPAVNGSDAAAPQPAANGTAQVAAEGPEEPSFVARKALPGLEGPWVGILASPSEVQCDDAATELRSTEGGLFGGPTIPSSCFNEYYAQWVEAAGARAFAIPFDASDELLELVVTGASAIVWPGGDLVLDPNTTFYQTARRLLDLVINANRQGRLMPLLGICQGHELMAALVHGSPSILRIGAFQARSVVLQQRLSAEAQQSELLATLGHEHTSMLANLPVALHINSDGVDPAAFRESRNLAALFRVVATATDVNQQSMVSIMEARTMPLIGIQWHPERSQFDWRPSIKAPHGPEAIAFAAGLADAFVNIARLSPHSMSTEQHRRMVLQTATRAAKRVSMGDLETSVTALLFDPPTPTAAEDGSRTVLGGHAWRLPADQVTDHSAQQPAAATNVTANATLADAPADEAAEAEGAE